MIRKPYRAVDEQNTINHHDPQINGTQITPNKIHQQQAGHNYVDK